MAVRERPVRRPVLFFEEALTKSTEETSRELEASRIMPTEPSRKPEASRRVWPSQSPYHGETLRASSIGKG